MKYLVITKRRHIPLPASTMEPARHWIHEQITASKLDCCYGMPGGGISIANAKSHDELMRMLMSYPDARYVDYEIHPLCEIDIVFDEAEALAARGCGA